MRFLNKVLVCVFLLCNLPFASAKSQIDRKALVSRHNIRLTQPDILSPLSVGTGAFAFTADVTGLQTFEKDYLTGIPLGTMADWAWHETPNPEGYKLEDTMVETEGNGHKATYPLNTNSPASPWVRSSPHRYSLGQIGLVMKKSDGTKVSITDLNQIDQHLDLWNGLLSSQFKIEGKPVSVETCATDKPDTVHLKVDSSLFASGELTVRIAFPYPNAGWGKSFNEWNKPQAHQTRIVSRTAEKIVLARTMDTTRYLCTLTMPPGTVVTQKGPHELHFLPAANQETLTLSVAFHQEETTSPAPSFEAARKMAASAMQAYWRSGGAVDLSQSKDPRWRELERRIVLSQYLTGIQSRTFYPPQETGLTCNSWHGKFHLEMHWWHSVHFALWGRSDVLKRQMEWYKQILPEARGVARRQNYAGARWPKMVGPSGIDATSGVGPLLVWQQPHPIYYYTLLAREDTSLATAKAYREIVFETADFMADFAAWDDERKKFDLGPPFASAREFNARQYAENKNGSFELVYWAWALDQANALRQKLGMKRNEQWEKVARNMAPLPTVNGIYVEQEQVLVKDDGHPCMLAAWGLLPKSAAVDANTMTRTMEHVLTKWPHKSTWGWDYPMMAMTAARIGKPEWAIDSLLLETGKNRYLPNGHNYQKDNLPLYLPGNGGLLSAVAMMAAGWDNGPEHHAPGFPQDGNWTVRHEGLRRMP